MWCYPTRMPRDRAVDSSNISIDIVVAALMRVMISREVGPCLNNRVSLQTVRNTPSVVMGDSVSVVTRGLLTRAFVHTLLDSFAERPDQSVSIHMPRVFQRRNPANSTHMIS